MNPRVIGFVLLFALLLATPAKVGASTFTYQGRLVEEAGPSSGAFDLEFKLFDAASAGNQIGQPFHAIATPVEGGIFTVELTFPDTAFTGQDRWLQIGVRTNGGATFTDLTPRQKIGSFPQASYAATAARTLSNSVDTASIAPGAVTSSTIADGAVVRSLNGLTDHVQLVAGSGIVVNSGANGIEISSASAEWSLNGNVASSNQFIGSVNDAPVHIRVNNTNVLRFEPRPESANITAGYPGNQITALREVDLVPIYPQGSVISGGAHNLLGGFYSVIGGGESNSIGSSHVDTCLGITNIVTGVTIGGGRFNTVFSEARCETGGAQDSTISGGRNNKIWFDAPATTISGGASNVIGGCCDFSTIGGGRNNSINGDCHGHSNVESVIAGGSRNVIRANAFGSTISGGSGNRIEEASSLWAFSAIGGGENNVIRGKYSVIGGGHNNYAVESTVGGGGRNKAEWGSVVAGGGGNTASGMISTIGGGEGNTANAYSYMSCISGGYLNTADGPVSSIPGGMQAKTYNYGQLAFASGQFSTNGDAQFSMYVLRGSTLSSSPVELSLNGIGGSAGLLKMQTNSAWSFDALIIGRSVSRAISFQVRGAVDNNADTCALIGTPVKQMFGNNSDGLDVNVTADPARRALIVTAVGRPNEIMRWVANVRVAEVGF